jgi:hypothetical protein
VWGKVQAPLGYPQVPVVTLKCGLGAILKLNLVYLVDSGRFQTVSDIY